MSNIPCRCPSNYSSFRTLSSHPLNLPQALVDTAEGTNVLPAELAPSDAPYAPTATGSDTYSSEVKAVIVPNDLFGPSVILEAFDFAFAETNDSLYTAHTFHALINQPQILTNAMCQRNNYYFNVTGARTFFSTGTVTVSAEPEGRCRRRFRGSF